MRIGHGYDVHRFSYDRKLILCGTEIPYEKGLDGHSDADVAVHALMDAILGAGALGDIGKHFPPSEMQYKGISSIVLLKRVINLLDKSGYRLSNADITIIAEKPKLSSFIETMRAVLAEAMNTDIKDISIKATTEEGLGFTGSMLGIAAHSVVLIDDKKQ